MHENGTDVLTATELAAKLRVRPETVRAWTRQGLIPALRLSKKTIRYDLAAVLDAMQQQRRGCHGVTEEPHCNGESNG